MFTDLFPEILGYTQNLNHHVSTTSNNVADVSKVQDSNVQAHHLMDLGHVASGHPLTRRKTKLLTIHRTLQRHVDDIEESTDDSDVHMGNRRHFKNVGDSHKHLYEEATVSSEDQEVQGMVQIGEALLIKDNSNLYAFEGDIQK
ncbi:hypothetical protein NC651_011867 [Populus alba x Populus x berolinensis]|nr:hypothetical protein NC651_011867 [Populus alba x Populus x berolinensis]